MSEAITPTPQDWIPIKVRAWIYRALSVGLSLNLIFGWLDDGVVGTITKVAAVLGVGLASAHTPIKGQA